MKKNTILLFIFFTVGCIMPAANIYAQSGTDSFKENAPDSGLVTDVIFSVDPKNNGVNGVFIKELDTEAQLYKLKGECYRCEFYLGSIEGAFNIVNSKVKPVKNAIITIYTSQNLMRGKVYEPGPFPPGSRFNLARTKTTVIEKQNGKFRLRSN